MKLLLLDNYDSFTYNLYDYFLQLGADCMVLRNDEKTLAELKIISIQQAFDAIILSPGPKAPKDAGILMEVIAYYHDKLPILGICLGHQGIGEFFGMTLTKAVIPIHGKTSPIVHSGHYLFNELPYRFDVMRYHSLLLKNIEGTPLEITAITDQNEIMALTHQFLPIVGVQFHPESILTEFGLQMLQNFLTMVTSSR